MSASWRGRVKLSEADALPGRYYATARDRHGRTAFLLGPFTQPTVGREGHARALGACRKARIHVLHNYPGTVTMGMTFGTARLPLYTPKPPVGKLNEVLACSH